MAATKKPGKKLKHTDGLLDKLESLSPSTLSAIHANQIDSPCKVGISIDDGILFLARFGELFKPVVFDNTRESRGGTNKEEALRILVVSLADIHQRFSLNLNEQSLYDFINETIGGYNAIEHENIEKMKQLNPPVNYQPIFIEKGEREGIDTRKIKKILKAD